MAGLYDEEYKHVVKAGSLNDIVIRKIRGEKVEMPKPAAQPFALPAPTPEAKPERRRRKDPCERVVSEKTVATWEAVANAFGFRARKIQLVMRELDMKQGTLSSIIDDMMKRGYLVRTKRCFYRRTKKTIERVYVPDKKSFNNGY